jgi:hypothetical protein
MGGGHIEAPAFGQAQQGQDGRLAKAASDLTISEPKGRATREGLYQVTPEGGEPFTIEAKGREAWALDRLRASGPKGCTPRTEPAPRWSACVRKLREHGVPIETSREDHGGDFPGTHGRHVLRATAQKGGAR